MKLPNVSEIWKLRALYRETTDEGRRLETRKEYRLIMHEIGSSIHFDTVFSGKPFFPHGPYSIFISRGAKIGKNVIILQQTTIGSNFVIGSKSMGSPKIGDNVYIGAGAKIIGNVYVGNNVLIGANATVVTDVPDNSVVVGTHARILHRESVDARYFPRMWNWVGHFTTKAAGSGSSRRKKQPHLKRQTVIRTATV